MKALTTFKRGIFAENPTFILLLGMCPTLAVTTSIKNAIGMGLSATAVLVASNIFISAFKKLIPSQIRIASYIVLIAGFVSIVDMLLKAYLPDLAATLGIFIPLITVNCIILARAEAFASKNSVWLSAADGVGMGLGFTAALIIMAVVREVLGNGSFFGWPLPVISKAPALIMILAPGGFLALGLILGALQWISDRRGKSA